MTAAPTMRSRRDVVPVILAAVRDALTGQGSSAVVLRAASGAGKSHLLQHALPQLSCPARVVEAVPASVGRAYTVAAELLGTEVPDPVPARFDEALLERFDELASAGPLVLVVDDLQFVDVDSLRLLDQLMSDGAARQVAVVATVLDGAVREEVSRIEAHPDVLMLDVPPCDLVDLDALVHEHVGAWPGPGVRALLAPVASNALHVLSIVDGLVAAGALRGDVLDIEGDSRKPTPDLEQSVAATIAALQGVELDAARAVAVLGAPARIEELAELLAVPPMSLAGPVQRMLDSRLFVEHGDKITFAHDLYRAAVYDAAPAPVRRLLHTAAGQHSRHAERARHVIASATGGDEIAQAVLAAAEGLDNAPGVTAELAAEALARTDVGAEAAAALAATRARALARSGRLREAAEAARAAQPQTRDPAVLTALRRVELFSLTTQARVDEALELVDQTLALPLPDQTRELLTQHRGYLRLLGGRGPVPLEPFAPAPDDLRLNGLVAEALRRCLLGDTATALEYSWTASRRFLAPGRDQNEGLSADVWLPFIELFHSGPAAARIALNEVVRLREERGDSWQTASHQAIAGGIDALAGRLDDAVADYDAAWESAVRTELGWTSQIVGWRALLDVLRGDVAAAGQRLAAWDAAPGETQLGIPQVERARMAALEAERRYAEAAAVARRLWSDALEKRLFAWAAMTAPEVARVALRAADDDLRTRVATGLATMPEPVGEPPGEARRLAVAMCGAARADLPTLAASVSESAAVREDGLLRLTAVEEAAIATALTGDRDEARRLAREAIAIAQEFGAAGVVSRIAGRMRAAGVRLGATTTRARPTHGWGSLTPTERLVVDLVARGLPGPAIARQLHLSPRTVQTHVSHVLAKLGVANRVELAAYAVVHGAEPSAMKGLS
jgi:DNA-binding CsgD family transcriptional regulator